MAMQSTSTAKKVLQIIVMSVCFIAIAAVGLMKTLQLSDTQVELASTQTELASTTTDLINTQNTLATTETELSQTKEDISSAEAELTDTDYDLQITYKTLDTTTDLLNQAEKKYDTTYSELVEKRELCDTLQPSLDNLQADYDRLIAGYGYTYRDPTYQELMDFLAADTTDANDYDLDSYVCSDFSADVKAHAMQQKFRCAFVLVIFTDSSHAIVVFNTTDRGIVYIEPQTDEEVNLQVGWHYWRQCVISKTGTPRTDPTSYNDTVENFYVIW